MCLDNEIQEARYYFLIQRQKCNRKGTNDIFPGENATKQEKIEVVTGKIKTNKIRFNNLSYKKQEKRYGCWVQRKKCHKQCTNVILQSRITINKIPSYLKAIKQQKSYT